MSNRDSAVRSSTASSSGVSRSISSVARPAALAARAPRTDCAGCAGCCRCRGRTPRCRALRWNHEIAGQGCQAPIGTWTRFAMRAYVITCLYSPDGNVSATSPASHSGVRSSGSTRARLVDVQDVVELLRQPRVEIVARAFALRQVEHADGALEPRTRQRGRQLGSVRSGSRNRGMPRVVKQPLVAPGQRRSDVLAMRRTVPFGRGGHRAAVRGEPDEHGVARRSARARADRRSARRARPSPSRGRHRGASCAPRRRRARRAASDRGTATSSSSVSTMCRSRRFHDSSRPREHRPVVLLGVPHEPRILLGKEDTRRRPRGRRGSRTRARCRWSSRAA